MTTTTMERDLLNLEREYWDAVAAKDSMVASRLTADQCMLVSPSGIQVVNPGMAGKMLAEGDGKLLNYDITDVTCSQIDDNNAALAYNVKAEFDIAGQTTKLDAREASVWTRRNGQWVCALHCEALPGDPHAQTKKTTNSKTS
jgi:hypothetical protein